MGAAQDTNEMRAFGWPDHAILGMHDDVDLIARRDGMIVLRQQRRATRADARGARTDECVHPRPEDVGCRDELGDEAAARAAVQLLLCADLNDAPAIHH
ncbi:MAG: hypothetical protein ACREF3_09070, partial [Acetobacteraceae bacterium]